MSQKQITMKENPLTMNQKQTSNAISDKTISTSNQTKSNGTPLLTVEAKILYFVSVIFACLLFSFYYYRLQFGFSPNGEDLLSLQVPYKDILNGTGGASLNIWNTICYFGVKLFGFHYNTLRKICCFVYFMISFFTLDLCLRKRNWEIRFHVIPAYILFMVFMHPGSSANYGQLTEKVHQYPFNNHMIAVLAAVSSLWAIYYIEKYSGKKKKILQIMAALWLLLCLKQGDTLYFITFIAPLFLVWAKKLWKQEEKFYKVICYILLAIFALRMMGTVNPQFGNKLFPGSTVRYGDDTVIYGAANFIGLGQLPANFQCYLSCLTGLFHFDFAGKSALSLEIVIYVIKAFLVIFVYIMLGKALVGYFKKSEEKNTPQMLISLGVLLLSVFFILTENGELTWYARYLTTFIPYFTIILCWHMEDLHKILHFDFMKNKQLVCGIFVCILLAAFHPQDLKEKEPDSWDKDYEMIVKIADLNQLQDGVGQLFTSGTFGALSEGRHMVEVAYFNTDRNCILSDGAYGSNRRYDFILLGKYYMDDFGANMQQLIDVYGNPDMVVDTEYYKMVIYKDGIWVER